MSAVLYHYPCTDGVFGALATYLYHKAVGESLQLIPNAVYKPIKLDDVHAQKFDVVYLVDYIGPEGFAMELSKVANNVVILDHHKTSFHHLPPPDEAPKNMHIVLDMNRSGATIAYDYFRLKLQEKLHSNNAEILPIENLEQVKRMYEFVEDGDLWRWNLPESKAFYSGLKGYGLEYSAKLNPLIFDQLMRLNPDKVINRGIERLAEEKRLIDSTIEKSFPLQIGDGKFGCFLGVRADEVQQLRSDIGNELSVKSYKAGMRAIGAVVYEVEELSDETVVKVSLRSHDKGVDTTQISEAYGGGGHRSASAFMVSKTAFENWKMK